MHFKNAKDKKLQVCNLLNCNDVKTTTTTEIHFKTIFHIVKR